MPRYPATRLRRLRQSDWIRRMVNEHTVTTNDLIWPVFVQPDGETATEVASMPGVWRHSIESLIPAITEARDLGIPAIAIFPQTNADRKTWEAEEAVNGENLVCRAVSAVKKALPEIGIICDVALDPYTIHGHDGLVRDGVVVNDETVEMLCRQAIVQAQAGCDVIAPSDMMDGRVGAIRKALDAAGFDQVMIMSYAAKYASAFYGPFREAIGSKFNLSSGNVHGGGKQTYQMNPGNSEEAVREVQLDIDEGADMVMIKPGMPYLDIVRRVKDTFGVPTFAYQVSGEYAMLVAAGNNGWLDRQKVMMESLLSFKRAGADGILTYFAVEAARLMQRA
jgi:porphobilinogen synthase